MVSTPQFKACRIFWIPNVGRFQALGLRLWRGYSIIKVWSLPFGVYIYDGGAVAPRVDINTGVQDDEEIAPAAGFPRGSIYATIMELGPQNSHKDGDLGPNSKLVVRIWSFWIRAESAKRSP